MNSTYHIVAETPLKTTIAWYFQFHLSTMWCIELASIWLYHSCISAISWCKMTLKKKNVEVNLDNTHFLQSAILSNKYWSSNMGMHVLIYETRTRQNFILKYVFLPEFTMFRNSIFELAAVLSKQFVIFRATTLKIIRNDCLRLSQCSYILVWVS